MPRKIFTQELEGTRRRGRPRKRWKEEVERDLQVLGMRRCRELVADREKNGRTLFDRPKPTVGCSANGRRHFLDRFFRKILKYKISLKSTTLNYALHHRVGREVLCSRTLPDEGSPVPKHVVVLTLFMNCILLSAFVGWCCDCKNMHGVSNIKYTTHDQTPRQCSSLSFETY